MKKKHYLLIPIIIIGLIILSVNVVAFSELKGFKNSVMNAREIQMTLKDYHSGRTIDVVDYSLINEICAGFSDLQYGGIFVGESRIDSIDQAYSMVISTDDSLAVVVVSNSHKQSRIIQGVFSISVNNYDRLYHIVSAVFDQ